MFFFIFYNIKQVLLTFSLLIVIPARTIVLPELHQAFALVGLRAFRIDLIQRAIPDRVYVRVPRGDHT